MRRLKSVAGRVPYAGVRVHLRRTAVVSSGLARPLRTPGGMAKNWRTWTLDVTFQWRDCVLPEPA